MDEPFRGPPGPYETALLAVDLVSGLEIGQISLPGLRAGWWTTNRPSAARRQSTRSEWPAIVVAPSGNQIAIVSPDVSTITIVDSQSMTRTRQITLDIASTPPIATATGESALAGTPAAPLWTREGVFSSGVFTSDGQTLFVTGRETTSTSDLQSELVTL